MGRLLRGTEQEASLGPRGRASATRLEEPSVAPSGCFGLAAGSILASGPRACLVGSTGAGAMRPSGPGSRAATSWRLGGESVSSRRTCLGRGG